MLEPFFFAGHSPLQIHREALPESILKPSLDSSQEHSTSPFQNRFSAICRHHAAAIQRRNNVEAVTDFADGRHFIRLHRDIVLPAPVCEAVRKLLTANRWEDAKSLALEHAPADAHNEINLFFDSASANLTAEAPTATHA